MRIVYDITNQDHHRVYETRTFKRRDAAANHLVRMVREAVASNAGLDTAWGRAAYDEAERYAQLIEAPASRNMPCAKLIPVFLTHSVMFQARRA